MKITKKLFKQHLNNEHTDARLLSVTDMHYGDWLYKHRRKEFNEQFEVYKREVKKKMDFYGV